MAAHEMKSCHRVYFYIFLGVRTSVLAQWKTAETRVAYIGFSRTCRFFWSGNLPLSPFFTGSHMCEKNQAPSPFQSAELAPFCGIYQGIRASLNCWPSQSRSKKEWKADIWYLSIMILPPHFQMLNISIFKWLVFLSQSFFRQSFLCYSTSALDLFFMPLLGRVSTGDGRNRKSLRGQIPALKCQALSLSLCSGVVAATLAETVQGRVTRFKWYRNVFKDCFSGCWQKVTQSVNGRSCSWMGNKKSVFLVAMALLHWLVSVWEGQSLVLHHHTFHPSSNFPVSLECVTVRGCEVAFRTLFQAMF